MEAEEMTKHVHVSSSKEAWEEARLLLPEGVSRDERVTWARVYRGNGNRHVVDLGDRIEVNHGEYGELTTMVWIDRQIIPLRERIRALQERRRQTADVLRRIRESRVRPVYVPKGELVKVHHLDGSITEEPI